MRIRKATICSLLLLAIAATAESQTLFLRISALNRSVRSGSRVMIEVTTTNRSNHPISYHDVSRSCDFNVIVLTSDGTSAPETEFKRNLRCNGKERIVVNRNILVTLKPGDSSEDRIEITELYDMSRSGMYTVRVDRTIPGVGHFTSEPESVTVTP